MIYNTVSTENIISKIFRDLDIQEENSRITDFIEWIGEGLTKIGAFKSLNVKVTGKEDEPILSVSNYQAQLPKDLVKIIGVAYSDSINGNYIPLRYGTGNFDGRADDDVNTSGSVSPSTDDLITLAMDLYDLDYDAALDLINTDSVIKSKLTSLLTVQEIPTPQTQTNPTLDYTYVINGSYIKLNVKEGYLMVAYTAYPIDENGYPLIPDDPSFFEALYWYVVTKYWYPDWVQGRIRDRVYYDAKNSWNFYRKQAYAHAMMPSVDQHESLKNQTLKLYPEIDSFQNFFATLGEQQILYSH